MLHRTPGQTKEAHKSLSPYITDHSSEFHLWHKQIAFTVKPSSGNKLTAEQR